MLKLVLLPGMDGSGEFFTAFIEALATNVETMVVAYPQDKALNYSQLTEYVEKRLPKAEPFALLGESFSGPIAIRLAANKPKNLCAVILVCSFMRSPVSIPKILHNIACLLPVSWIPSRILDHYLLGKNATPKLLAHLKSSLASIANPVFRERGLSILTVDASQALAEVTVPILYLRASQDKIVPKQAAELIVKQQPNTAIVTLEGPHFILQTQPKLSAQQILSFLQRWL